MDVCVVLYHSTADNVVPHLREHDTLLIRDNTTDNIGFAAGANAAARQGSHEYVLFINPDGDPSPGCLDALEAAMADVSVVAVQADEGPGWERPLLSDEGDIDWLSGSCLLVRRSDFEAVGGFDEQLFMYCEDVDLSYKLARRGRLKVVREVSFNHARHQRPFRSLHRF